MECSIALNAAKRVNIKGLKFKVIVADQNVVGYHENNFRGKMEQNPAPYPPVKFWHNLCGLARCAFLHSIYHS